MLLFITCLPAFPFGDLALLPFFGNFFQLLLKSAAMAEVAADLAAGHLLAFTFSLFGLWLLYSFWFFLFSFFPVGQAGSWSFLPERKNFVHS